MNYDAFIKYLITNRGRAWVGNEESLEVAKQLQEDGILKQDGEREGKPLYSVTMKGQQFLAQQLLLMPKEEMKKTIEAAMKDLPSDGT